MKMRLFVIIILLCLSVFFVLRAFPKVAVLRDRYPHVVYERGKAEPKIFFSSKRPAQWVDLSAVSKVALAAIVMSEDSAFYQHKGIDQNQIKEAFEVNLRRKRFARGASTITQQVVRNLFLDRDKNLWRKIKEIILAMRFEKTLNKRKILEIYINIVEWGPAIFGILRASQYYFGKHPSELTAKEGAFLAMLLPNPKKYAYSYRQRQLTSYASKRIEAILEKLVQAQYLTQQQYDQERSFQLEFN